MSDIPHCTGCGEYPGDLVADRIEELEAENKNLRHMIIDQIESAGDDPEIMAASRAEWAARAKAAEARIEELEAKLAVTWDTQTVKILVTSAYKEGWADGADNVPLGSGWVKSRTNATLAELTGGKDD